MKRLIIGVLFHCYLKHLIRKNYALRANGAPDEWYWADLLCSGYGYYLKE